MVANNVHPKEFSTLLQLLCEIHKCATSAEAPKLNELIDWTFNDKQMQDIRQKVMLVSLKSYQIYCRLLGIEVVKKSEVQTKQKNGHSDDVAGKPQLANKIHKKRKATIPNDNEQFKNIIRRF